MWAGLAVAVALAAASSHEGDAPPSDQTVVFYNARISLREGRAAEALKFWLLRNSINAQGRHLGKYDEEFRSVVWAALGQLGICQDGYPKDDEGGAGLWPLSLHNWVLYASRGIPPGARNPWDAFEAGRQQRFITLHSIVSNAELRSTTFFRTSCFLPETTLLSLGKAPSLDLQDKLSTGPFLKKLLQLSLKTLVRDKVMSVSAIEARIFDLDLAIAQLLERKAKRDGTLAKQKAKMAGVSDVGAKEAKDAAMVWPKDSPQAAFLRRALTWSTSDWLTLNRQRRLFLFSKAKPFAPSPAATDPLVLSLIDEMIARKEGAELEKWIGNFDAKDARPKRAALMDGERGKRLLDLEPEKTGFRERAVVAMHRGVTFLEAGALQEALRSFAYAMGHADESTEANTILPLARRWVSYVLSKYETTPEVIATLKALVPKGEYNAVIEDLIWRAALRSDERSFELVVASTQRGGALDAKVTKLRLLAQGKQGALATELRDAAVDEPHLTLRFGKQLLEKLEAEDVDVRRANVPLLKQLNHVYDTLIGKPGGAKAQQRSAEELISRAQGMLEGLALYDNSVMGKARDLSPRHETFAGNIRLAPSDPLPWPFAVPTAEAPSAFTPMVLKPVEWRGADGQLVFGWKIGDDEG